jgi:hypothetical protein
MKKIFFLIFLLLFHLKTYSVDYKYISNFGGINTYTNSSKISDNDAIDAVNVLTDEGYLQKRPGSSVFYDTLNQSNIIKNIYEYVTSNKTRYLIYLASNTLYATDFSQDVPIIISTVNPDYLISAVSAWNKMFFTNKFEDPFYWTPASGKVVINTMPHCKFIDFADERLYCVNSLEYGDSAMSISKYGEYDVWQIPTDRQLTADDPNLIYFDNDDGQGITCFKATPFGKIVWKKNSMYVLKGYDNDTYYKYKLSDNIGCVDNGSIRFLKNTIIWLSRDGVYAWDGGSQIKLLSQEIFYDLKNNKQANFNQNSIIYKNKDSFDEGVYSDTSTLNPTNYYDALEPKTFRIFESTIQFKNGTKENIVYDDNVGGLYIPPIQMYDDFEDGEYYYNPSWTVVRTNPDAPNPFSVVSHSGSKMLQYTKSDYSDSNIWIYTSTNTSSYGRWTIYVDGNSKLNTLKFVIISNSTDVYNFNGYFANFENSASRVCLYRQNGSSYVQLGCSTNGTFLNSNPETFEIIRSSNYFKIVKGTNTILNLNADNAYTSSNYMMLQFFPNNSGDTAFVDNIAYSPLLSEGTYYSQVYNTGSYPNIATLLETNESLDSGTTIYYYYNQSYDGNTWDGWVQMYKDYQPNITKQYVKFKYYLSSVSAFKTPVLYSVKLNLRQSIGEYLSNVHYITPNITKWLTFFASENKGRNTIKYYVRGNSNGFNKLDNSIQWIQINNNNVLPFNLDTRYVQFRVRFETNYPDENKVNAVSLNWQEGDNIPVASATNNDKRYIICISTIPGSQFNDICYIFQDNAKWVKMKGKTIVSMNLFNNDIIAGSNDGKIYKLFDNTTYTDDGQPINAYWITGDMMFDAPFMNKVIREIWVDAESQNTNLTIGYSTNKSDMFKEKTINLFDMGKYLAKRVDGLPDGYDYGRYIRFKISNNNSSNFKLNSVIILYDVEKLKPY